jgi:hypothetical protein
MHLHSQTFVPYPLPEEPVETGLRRAYLAPPAETDGDRMKSLLIRIADRLAAPPPRPRHRRV